MKAQGSAFCATATLALSLLCCGSHSEEPITPGTTDSQDPPVQSGFEVGPIAIPAGDSTGPFIDDDGGTGADGAAAGHADIETAGGTETATGGGVIDWTDCGVVAAIPGVSAEEFCDLYFTTDCSLASDRPDGKASCAARYSAYNIDQRNCAAYVLCRAKTMPAFCPHLVGPGGPCNLP